MKERAEPPPPTEVPSTPILQRMSETRAVDEAESVRLYGRPPPEPLFNANAAPWPLLLIMVLIGAAFSYQLLSGDFQGVVARHGFLPIELSAGRPLGLITSIFLHGGWGHLLLNLTVMLAFGAPVARLFGSRAGGALRFAGYFMVCGIVGGLVYWALHPSGAMPIVGASGAVYGLVGGVARMVEHPGAISRSFSRPVLRFLTPWVILNLLVAVAGAAFTIPVAWEAHLGGLLAGLLLIGLFAPRRRLG